jgi:hypothetical protein
MSECNRLFSQYGESLGALYNRENTNWPNIINLATFAKESAQKLEQLTGNHEIRKSYASVYDLLPVIKEMVSALKQLV